MINNVEFNARQKDFDWFSPKDVLIIGAGGIGSWLALSLSRANNKILLYDFDRIDAHNIGGQLFSKNDIGRLKTDAIRKFISEYSDSYVNTYSRYDEAGLTAQYTFLAVDNMEVRKLAVEKWFKMYGDYDDKILIDGRMEGEQGIIYIIKNGDDYNRWMAEWFSDDEIQDGLCTMRATSFNGMMIAANMTAVFNNYIANKATGMDIREVPYKIEYGFQGLIYDIIR